MELVCDSWSLVLLPDCLEFQQSSLDLALLWWYRLLGCGPGFGSRLLWVASCGLDFVQADCLGNDRAAYDWYWLAWLGTLFPRGCGLVQKFPGFSWLLVNCHQWVYFQFLWFGIGSLGLPQVQSFLELLLNCPEIWYLILQGLTGWLYGCARLHAWIWYLLHAVAAYR